MQIITRDFHLAWDIRSVAWAATVLYNVQRAICSSAVWSGTLVIALALLGTFRVPWPFFCCLC